MLSLHHVSARAKRVVPKWIWSPARKLLTALLAPVQFSLKTGHFRSSLGSAAVDRQGKPIPWYTYPAIDFLDTKDFSTKIVLEFGSGQSTLWWAKRAKQVLSFECNPEWFAYVKSTQQKNSEVLFIPYDLVGLEDSLHDRKFDVIIVDGHDRLKAASHSIGLLHDEGAIIVDNSECCWGCDAGNTYPLLDLFRSKGFFRIDFYGYAPGVVFPHCTSLFFKEQSFVIRGEENVVRNKYPKGS